MKTGRRRLLLGALGLGLFLVVVAALVLPRLVDAESYRGFLRQSLERQLGRDVQFGAMDLSIWPVLGLRLDDLVIGKTAEERFEQPVVADSLRVGARLFPLLRGRLEVTSILVEGPVVTLFRRNDGTLEPFLDQAPPADPGEAVPEPADGGGPPLIVERLKVTRGRIVLRHEAGGELRETALDGLELSLDDLGGDGRVTFALSVGVGKGALDVTGTMQPEQEGGAQPLRMTAEVRARDLSPAAAYDWLAALAPDVTLPPDLMADRAFSAAANIDYSGGTPGRLVVTGAEVRGLGLRVVRSPAGTWNTDALSAGAADELATQPEALSIHLADLKVEGVSLEIEDRAGRGEPVKLAISPLGITLRQAAPEAPMTIELDARGGAEGKAALAATLSYAPANGATPARVTGKMTASEIDPRDLALATRLGMLPPGVIVGRRFGLSTDIEAMLPVAPAAPEVTLRNVSVRHLDLGVERDASGGWNFAAPTPAASPATAGKPAPSAPSAPAATIRAERIELSQASLRVTDRMSAGSPGVFTLGALHITLDRLPTDGRAALELDAQVGSGKDGKLTVRGTIGPLGADATAMPLDLTLALGALPLSDLGSLLAAPSSLNVQRAALTADLRLAGNYAKALTVTGDAALTGATVAFASPNGETRTLPFELRARTETTLRDAGARIDLTKLDLELPRDKANRTLSLRGSLNASAEPMRIDVQLLPTRVAADDLAALAAVLAPDAPLSFASPDPVDIELRAKGALGGDTLPDLDGRATLSGFTFRFPGMQAPMERVGAKVAFTGNQVTLENLVGAIGKSDVTDSRVVVTDFASPRVQLNLKSTNADFWELFSFIEPTDPAAAPLAADDPLVLITVQGKLAIESGSLQTLTFQKLVTDMDYRGGVLTLSPLTMNLYGGRFSGKIVQDLNTGVLTFGGSGAEVEAEPFLAQNLDLGGMIAGRATTELNLEVRFTDPANVLAGVSGGGPLSLTEGRLAKLDVLKSLSKVTGVFGERSLQRLTKQLSTAGTPFKRAETRLKFDAGTLSFEDLVVEMSELTLAGRASMDSATGKLDGRFAVAFSPELSASMREENSRAADLFWDPKTGRVGFDFGVRGLATAPSINLDWETAVRGVAERTAADQLRSLLDRKLGKPSPAPAPATPPPATAGEATPPPSDGGSATGGSNAVTEAPPAAQAPPADPAPSAATESGLVATITNTRFRGPVLLRDLAIEGTVRGAAIERASLVVVDARGTEIRKIDRIAAVDEQLAAQADRDAIATLTFNAEIDGKRLAVARFPVIVTVTVVDRQGRSATASREVNR